MKPITKLLIPAALLGTNLLGAALLPPAARADGPYYPARPRPYQDRPHVFRGALPTEGGVRWTGDVDDTTLVYIHRGDVRTENRAGKAATNIDVRQFGYLPERPVSVFLRRAEGRGQVRIVRQPSPDNDFTAVVRIHDPQAGRAHYAFELAWSDRPEYRYGDH